jgi:dihydroorotase
MQHSALLLKNGTVLDPEDYTTREVDIRITDGQITAIGADLDVDDTPVEDCSGRMISPGWFDMHVHFREPGYEHKETIATGVRAAAAGGFTGVACMPNTDPPIHTRDVVEYVIEQADDLPVAVHPIGCVSKERAGEQLAEMADLAEGGAVAFSDDGAPVQHSGLMRRALEYSSMLDRPIINHMEDLTLNVEGHMHEGEVATHLGLAGIPPAAEEVMIARDAILAEYTEGYLHVAHISTARGVELVRQAKARGVAVTAEVCPHHFTLTDEAVAETSFSTHTKMHPPLRSRADVEAIKAGLADGTIDAICTDHAPHASFEKEVEFTQAPFGIIGLETAWGLIGRELIAPGILTAAEAVHKLTVTPRRILRLPVPKIAEDHPANLTIFDASTRWTFSEDDVRSKSSNSPFTGTELVGRPHAIYNRGELVRRAQPLSLET